MVNRILILTEAGKNIGFGHYTRCSALRQELIIRGIMVRMFLYLSEYDIEDPQVNKINWLTEIRHIIKANEYDAVIIDSYLADEMIYSFLQSKIKIVIAIDDYNRIKYSGTIIINPNVFFDKINYANQTAKCIGGKDFVILRREFRQLNFTTLNENRIEEILITIGGSDFRKILPILTELCLETDIPLITVLAPDGFKINDLNKRVNILPEQSSASICQLMQRADLVISACGQTLHELASLGKATIGINLDIDQKLNQKYYLENGFLNAEINWNDIDFKGLIKTAIEYYKSFNHRGEIAEIGPGLINKNGVLNIATTLINL